MTADGRPLLGEHLINLDGPDVLRLDSVLRREDVYRFNFLDRCVLRQPQHAGDRAELMAALFLPLEDISETKRYA